MASPREPAPAAGGAAPSRFPGERLGLPESGRGSIARAGRRILGILIDWAIASLISYAFLHYNSWSTLGIFVLLQIVFIPTIGGSVGHRLVGLRCVKVGGGWIGIWRPIARTLLLSIVIPAVIWDSDQRGFHDKIAGTMLIRG